MNIRRQIKRDARRALRPHSTNAFVATALLLGVVILFIIIGVLFTDIAQHVVGEQVGIAIPVLGAELSVVTLFGYIVAVVVAVFAFVFTAPLVIGLRRFYLRVAEGQGSSTLEPVLHDFATLRRSGRAIVVRVTVALCKLLWGAVFLGPPTALTVWTLYLSASGIMRPGITQILMGVGVSLVCTAALVLYVVFCYRYFMAPYLCAQDDTLPVRVAIRRSVQLMRGNRWSTFALDLSMWWRYLCTLLLVPGLYTLPYIGTVRAICAKVIESIAPIDESFTELPSALFTQEGL